MNDSVLGVLGGMGPAATIDFLSRLLANTDAAGDQEHIATIVYSDPSTPDRSDAIMGRGADPLPALLRGVEFLSRAGVTAMAIPCNTAHYWFDQIIEASEVPVLSMVDAVAERIAETYRDSATIGLLSTDATAQAGIYAGLAARGHRLIDLLDLRTENPIAKGIQAVKSGDLPAGRSLLLEGADVLLDRGAEVLLYGCTEVSVVLGAPDPALPALALDSSEELARAAVRALQPQ